MLTLYSKVITKKKLTPNKKMKRCVAKHHIDDRKAGVKGMVLRHVPGTDMDLWFVQHLEDRKIGVYASEELEEIDLKKYLNLEG